MAGATLCALALGLGSSAVLWMPTLEVARHSARWNLGSTAQQYWSLHPLSMLQLVLPLFVVDLPLQAEWRQRLFEGREPFLESVYIGLPALALAGAALLGRARHSGVLTGIAVFRAWSPWVGTRPSTPQPCGSFPPSPSSASRRRP